MTARRVQVLRVLAGAVVTTALAAGGASAALTAEPVLGVPAEAPVPFGVTSEQGIQTWAYGNQPFQPLSLAGVPFPQRGNTRPPIVVLRTDANGIWQVVDAPRRPDGSFMTGFQPAAAASGARALAAQMTARGGGLLIGADGDAKVLLTRDPGGEFRQIPTPAVASDPAPVVPDPPADPVTPPADPLADDAGATADSPADGGQGDVVATIVTPPDEEGDATPTDTYAPAQDVAAVLRTGESLYADDDSRLPAAPLDDGAHTGVLIAPATPAGTGQDAVLHWDGAAWTREAIELPTGVSDLRVVALAAAAPDNAWLLASSVSADRPFLLFRRELAADAPPHWTLQTDPQGALLGTTASLPAGVAIAARESGQPLTVTARGVWLDGTIRSDGRSGDLTFFYTPGSGADGTGGRVVASWCDATGAAAALCSYPLGADHVEQDYRSYAWDGDGETGTRVISGYGSGVTLRLDGTTFVRVLGPGGGSQQSGAAAFSSPTDGWVGGPLAHITEQPVGEAVESWPVPFRRPLLAIAPEPGRAAGAVDAQALAVGDGGQVARYVPGVGWTPEFLLGGDGSRATPRLRGVAWPRSDLAFAVGDDGAMWRWRGATGLWESDPAAPLNFDAHLNAIAFDPANPDRGYAVGKNGTLLRYDKSWEQEPLPAGLEHAQFTSIAFAGSDALVTYRLADETVSRTVGGLLINRGSGWQIDEQAGALLGTIAVRPPLQRVAGLPDGGAVAAGPDVVIERDGPDAPWRYSQAPLPDALDVAALAAVREGDSVRAVISIEPYTNSNYYQADTPTTPLPPGAPPFVPPPDPLPASGFLLRETASGWRDEQHAGFPLPNATGDNDFPTRPDSVLALLLDGAGQHGWAVGGEPGSILQTSLVGASEQIQTAGVMRYPAEPPPDLRASPVVATPGLAMFAVGGGAQCASACAEVRNAEPGPDRWLTAALQQAGAIAGVRAFLYTGARLAPGVARGPSATRAREFTRYAELLAASPLPVFPAATDSDAGADGSTAAFANAFAAFGAPLGNGSAAAGIADAGRSGTGAGRTYYAFDSTGTEGTVRVLVLDYSAPTLDADQLCWLARGLDAAARVRAPAIVVGARPLAGAGIAADAGTVVGVLAGAVPDDCAGPVGGARASAYLFEANGENRSVSLLAAGASIPSYGSGTLGYTEFVAPNATANLTASGIMMLGVDTDPRRRIDPLTNQAPVSVRLIPTIGELALDATDGTLLRRSEPALFNALARRPRGGMKMRYGDLATPNPYIPIPASCLGAACAAFIAPEYEFSSSRTDIGDFVKQDPASTDEHAVLLGVDDKPIADPSSGLFCPYNEGTTTVTVRTGGIEYSQQVTVDAGSVRRPCGTVPLTDPPAIRAPDTVESDIPPPPPGPGPTPQPRPAGPLAVRLPDPPVVTPPTEPAPPARPRREPVRVPPLGVVPALLLPPFLQQLPNSPFLPPVIQPPPPPAARPSPPSGTSPVSAPVSQSATAPQKQREEEIATDVAHSMVAYRPREHEPLTGYLAGVVLLAAIAGVTIRRSRTPREPELAYSAVAESQRSRRRRR